MALTKVTGDFIKDGVLTQAHLHTSHGITTAHIGEGSNLYFTNARVDARIGDLSTSNLSEGSNLYYTDARARGAISVSGNALSYNSSTGVITSNYEESPTFTGNVTIDDGKIIFERDANNEVALEFSNVDGVPDDTAKLKVQDKGLLWEAGGTNGAKLWMYSGTWNSTVFLNAGTFNIRASDSTGRAVFNSAGLTITNDLDVDGGNITLGGTGRIQGIDTVSANTDAANKLYVDTQVAGIVDSAPSTLDTLNELAAALGDDANFSTTVTNSIATKMPIAGGTFTGQVNFSVAPFLTQGVDLVLQAASGSTDSGDIVFRDGSNNELHRLWSGTNTLNYRTAGGTGYQLVHTGYSGYNNSNWDTAYGWGDHASEGYFKKQSDIGGSANLNNYTTDGYYHQNSNANANSGSNYPVGAAGMLSVVSDGVMVYQTYHQYNGNAYYHRSYYNGSWYAWRKVWQNGNDGSGSGLDADLLDGQHASAFLTSESDTLATVTARGASTSTITTFSSDLIVNGDLKLSGSDSFIWTPNTSSGYTGFWDTYNSRVAAKWRNDLGWGILGDPESGFALKTHGNLRATGRVEGDYFVGTQYASEGYTIYKGYDNWNHMITVRGNTRPGQAKAQAAIVGAHITSFVEYAENNDTTGWWFTGSAGSTYAEVARITRSYSKFEGQLRSPIFYDSNDTTYYLDPNSTGTSIKVRGEISNPSVWINDGDNYNGYNENIRLFNAQNSVSVIAFSASGTSGTPTTSILGYPNYLEFRRLDQWQQRLGTNYAEAYGDYRAPIFYDSNNTTYFINPASNNSIKTVGDWRSDSSTWSGEFAGKMQYHSNYWYIQTTNGIFVRNASGANNIELTAGGTGIAQGDWRAPIFYDTNNTGYYTDPAGTSNMYRIVSNYHTTTGSTAPGYSGGGIEVYTGSNGVPAIGFHRGGYSATTLYEYDGELYVNPWTTRAQAGKLLSSGNWSSYVFNGTWNGANMPGSRWGGFSVNTGEIAFQRDNPNNGQMSILVDGNFYAGENNGFWSLYSGNSYNTKIGWVSNSGGDFAVSGGTRNLKQLNAIYDNNTTFYLDLDGTSKVYTIEDDHGNEMYTRQHSGSDFANGTLVVTDITSNAQHGDSFVLEATGKSYSSDPPFSFMVQGYLYNYTIINHSGVHFGKPGFTTMKVFDYNGVLAFWWPRVSYWNSFDVHVRDAGGHTRNRVTSISNSTEPSSSKKVSVTMRASSIYGYNPGTSYATNAYAQVYYDTDNTVYKLDPHSTSIVNTVHFGNNTNNGYVSGYGTYSLNVSRVAQMSLDWNANYNNPGNHGIMSTDSSANFADSVSINSYNDITLRLDSNNNNSVSYLRVKDGTTGSGNDIFTIDQAATAVLGRNGMNPQLKLLYVDSGSGAGWDTGIYVGRTDDLPNGTSFPTYTATGGYGIQFQANSDGVFYGMKQYTSGHYRPYINWGDDTSDSPMEIAYNGSTKYSFTYDGSFTAVGNGAFTGGYLYLSSGNSIFSPSGGVIKTASNFYAERFYDYDDTTRYVDVNSTSYIATLHTSGTIQAGSSGTGNIYLGNTGVSGSGNHFRFHTNNSHTYFDGNCGDIHWRQGSSTRFYFYMTTANMTINGTLTQYSDERLKQNVVTIDNALNKVNQLRGVYYNRTDINTEANQIGLIAQETESVVPEVVHTANDELGTKSISYGQLNALLVEAIKELKADNDSLRARIETLENQ